MGRIPRETIDGILDRLDIVEVISGYLPLKRAGNSFKACCPFHNEKTPSFVVSSDKQIFHCFGCHEGGNVIDFLMKYETLDFPDAVRSLASMAGIEIPEFKRDADGPPSLYSRICEANKEAEKFFHNVLKSEKGKKAMAYLTVRGVNRDTIDIFSLGYAPGEWEAFSRYARSKKIGQDVLKKAGLTVPGSEGRGDYDRFRDRVIFPIYNERGALLAFGGRVMDDRLPKYINSPESPVYSKSNLLYGLNFSKKFIREKGYAILVEGYMDVIMSFQKGVKNVVATSGTALTQRQSEILSKYTDSTVMVFDSDSAGESAGLRGLDILVENGMKVKVVTLPRGDDPDSFISREGCEAFFAEIDKASELLDYKLDLLVKKLGRSDIGGIVNEMLPTIAKIQNAVVQSESLRKLAGKLGIHEASLRVEMGKIKPGKNYRFETSLKTSPVDVPVDVGEVYILGLSIAARKNFELAEKELGSGGYRNDTVKRIMSEMRSMFIEPSCGSINPGKLLNRFHDDEKARQLIIKAMAQTDVIADPERAVKDCVARIKKEFHNMELKGLNERLKKAQDENDHEKIIGTLRLIDKLHKERVV